jgi:diguanylate cyclase (GGDEF)-like protein
MLQTLRSPVSLHRNLIARYGRDLAVALATAAIVVALQIAGYFTMQHQREIKARVDTEIVRATELNRGLNEAQDALHNFAGGGATSALDAFYTSLKEVEGAKAGVLDPLVSGHPVAASSLAPRIDMMVTRWKRVIETHRAGNTAGAVLMLSAPESDRTLESIRRTLRQIIDADRAASGAISGRLWLIYNILFWLQIAFAALMVASLARSVAKTRKEALAREAANTAEAMARRRLELLFQMHDMLQSAEDHRDANAILISTASQLAPELGGALYIFNNSGDRLQLATTWNMGDAKGVAETIMPGECWALKRGKAQLNAVGMNRLRCPHAEATDHAMLEIPMAARGQVLGMLVLTGSDGAFDIAEAQLIGSALADGMSLALSNIALRERLRNQALRDGLTGLYNRRYMEDVLDRFVEVSKNGGPETSLIMIDLDHFKAINDEHGHAAGDAILREIGAVMMSSLRKADVACRYGGEELAVILPGCPLATATERANALCARIEALSDAHGFRITASMGVATAPPNAIGASELIIAADKALYAAKAAGRNQVVSAGDPARANRRGAKTLQERLAAA